MAGQKKADSPVRIIGSRELHQNLPTILNELQHPDVRYVLTVHGKPRAVLVGAEPFLQLVGERSHPSETLVGLQLSALLGNEIGSLAIEDLEKAFDAGREDP
ncbi:type II toxin-antitoxin system prevent-host-death family antitoxin [Tautonia sociabilis]|uniref:Type II toxin-antitoxin system Phd/YefM family antitoxin n=1 Tax=Tautonia sociabilis TaxID=2080755 RepID=A0A432MKE8_9BACT|nr:type II toxin-antitoxin system prevent-host-death family antitoxin [Tautonia sociabilis]RUL87893.1 type II toxin-antitoxin system Phd/YefM family antitoxin [Tautonia sociabilis]